VSNRFTRARPGRSVPSHSSVGATRGSRGPYGSRGLSVGVVTATAIALLVAGCGGKSPSRAASSPEVHPPVGKLPQATTFVTLKDLPTDAVAATDGTVVHPTKSLPVSAVAGGPPVAILPAKQLGGPTWVPVVETTAGWQRVLLPSRPNGASGWIATGDGKVQTAHSPYAIKVDTSTRRLVLTKAARELGTWSVAVGAPKTPTPAGRTFILASLAPAKATYSPLILPVGAHSESLDTFGGGPGTVAFHGWPQKSVFGQAVTHGCVRVPADALKQLSKVPLGTPVSISN
jgi:lipoprotein-anchoring transpeptidase ErfK/SrfK